MQYFIAKDSITGEYKALLAVFEDRTEVYDLFASGYFSDNRTIEITSKNIGDVINAAEHKLRKNGVKVKKPARAGGGLAEIRKSFKKSHRGRKKSVLSVDIPESTVKDLKNRSSELRSGTYSEESNLPASPRELARKLFQEGKTVAEAQEIMNLPGKPGYMKIYFWYREFKAGK